MHYFSFHINDYRAATAHLSNDEDLAYRRLLDMYYDTEQPISLETQWVAKRLRLDTQVVDAVLKDMFEQTESGWIHARCNEEIAKYHSMAEKNKLNGIKGGRPRKPSGNPVGTHSQPTGKPNNNHKTLTNNEEPIIKTKVKNIDAPEGVSQDVWDSFVQQRKKARAVITQTVVDTIAKEAAKAGWSLEEALAECAARGWRGFKANWVEAKVDDFDDFKV
jgi:uncharacterized protein YdaU (DUF1376 family)